MFICRFRYILINAIFQFFLLLSFNSYIVRCVAPKIFAITWLPAYTQCWYDSSITVCMYQTDRFSIYVCNERIIAFSALKDNFWRFFLPLSIFLFFWHERISQIIKLHFLRRNKCLICDLYSENYMGTFWVL